MHLVDAIVRGFRRFGSETDHKLLVDARMVCIIGANEAGKSSLLKLLAESRERLSRSA
jgi:predicted ATP-dependent endonuclease of OLD family